MTMQKMIINQKDYYYEVFSLETGEMMMIIANNEPFYLGLHKVYSLYRYSIKYSIEDFVRYEQLIGEKNKQKQNDVQF